MNGTDRRVNGSGSPHMSRNSSRRRSQRSVNLSPSISSNQNPNDAASPNRRVSNTSQLPSPAISHRHSYISADPHHRRHSSIGDIHNELEQEQEAQVNRMLSMIRTQQQQLDTLRSQRSPSTQDQSATSAMDDALVTPQSERHFSFGGAPGAIGSATRPSEVMRQPSSTSIQQARSPALRPHPSSEVHDWPESPLISARQNSTSRRNSLRDEGVYYQAETANLQRENQMLKQRIRELEKQLSERQ